MLKKFHNFIHPQHNRFTEKEKKILHFAIMLAILFSFVTEGAKLADWNFLFLALSVEFS